MNDPNWDFLSDSQVMLAADMAVRKACKLFKNATYGDCHQDALIYLALHQGTVSRLYRECGEGDEFVRRLEQYIYTNCLRRGLVEESDRAAKTVYRDSEW